MVEDRGQTLISWEALEFTPVERGKTWYLLAGLIVVLLCAWAVWTAQWFTLGVIIMLAVVVWLMQRMKPRQFQHSLTDKGVLVGDRFVSYSNLRSFWVATSEGGTTLNLLPNRKFGLTLTLQLGSTDVEMVREILSSRLPEEQGRSEDMVDRIGRYFKL